MDTPSLQRSGIQGRPVQPPQMNLQLFWLLLICALAALNVAGAVPAATPIQVGFPPPLESYGDRHLTTIKDVLENRITKAPFNLIASLVFLGAVLHTFLAHQFVRWAHVLERRHQNRIRRGESQSEPVKVPGSAYSSMWARVLHFLGEVEAIFGIWVIPLCVLMIASLGPAQTLQYLEQRVSYTEPVFVVVIMVIASTRPVVDLAEGCLRFCARLGGGGPAAWWLSILILGPVLGSLITEPAAMTISALLLGQQFYALRPAPPLAYATLGLLFVNVSVGGVLTHFAAPPVLMVAGPWGWNTPFMFRHFGWVALVGITLATVAYYAVFRQRFKELSQPTVHAYSAPGAPPRAPVPAWVTIGHVCFLAWTVLNAHHIVLMVGGFLFFLAFFEVTTDHQSELQLRGPILVGFFLAGLVIHGGLQQWWIGPVLRGLPEVPLMLAALGLTAFNDNAAVTYLATLVPDLDQALKFAIVAGAVTGGGLTVIANAPNPAGQSILNRHFPEGIAPVGLLLGALPATVILTLCFLFLK